MKKVSDKRTIDDHIHYLRVLKEGYSYFQPEVRRAIGFALEVIVLFKASEKAIMSLLDDDSEKEV